MGLLKCIRCGNSFRSKYKKELCSICLEKSRKRFGKQPLFCPYCYSPNLEPSVEMPLKDGTKAVVSVKCKCGKSMRMNSTLDKSQMERLKGKDDTERQAYEQTESRLKEEKHNI